jgi:hypothetical protein
MLTILKEKPKGSIGILIINPFTVNYHVNVLQNKFNSQIKPVYIDRWDIKYTNNLEKGYVQIGQTGVSYLCKPDTRKYEMLINLQRDTIQREQHLLGKRIYYALLSCIAEKSGLNKTNYANYLNNLIFTQSKVNPTLLL